MFVEYTPEDGDARTWDFDPERVRSGAAALIEKRYGANWDTWRNDVRTGSAKARRVLLWHLLRESHATLRLEDVPDFYMSELVVHHSVAELLEIKDRLAKARLDAHDREQMEIALDIEITEAMGRENIADEDLAGANPKAESQDSCETTG